MGVRGTVILAVLVLLGVGYLLYEGEPPDAARQQDTLLGEPRQIDPTQRPTRLLEFSPGEIIQVTLSRDGERRIATRSGDGWEPKTKPPNAVADFLENLTSLAELMRIEAGPEGLREYGLEPPQAEIVLSRGESPPLVLVLGDRNPAATGAYVRVGRDGHVVLAGALVVWEFDKLYKALGGKAGEQ